MREEWSAWGEELEKLIGTTGIAPRADLAGKATTADGFWGFRQSIPVTLRGEAVLVMCIPRVGPYEDDVVALGLVDENGVGVIVRTSEDFERKVKDIMSSLRDRKVYVYGMERTYPWLVATDVIDLAPYWCTFTDGDLGSIPVPWQQDYMDDVDYGVAVGDMATALRFTLAEVLRVYHIYLTCKMDPYGDRRPSRRPSPPALLSPVRSIDVPPIGKD